MRPSRGCGATGETRRFRLSAAALSNCYICLDTVLLARRRGRRAFGKAPVLRGDRQFESFFLRRRVSLSSAFHGYRRKGRAFAGSMSLAGTRERDVLATSRLALAASL